MNIGERVKKLREQRGITQKALAEKVGVTPAVICQIERGTKVPNVIIAKLICDNLGANIDLLVAEGRPKCQIEPLERTVRNEG